MKKFCDSKIETLLSRSIKYEGIRLNEMSIPGVNAWLNVIPVQWKQHLLLGRRDFQDALLLRFNKKPSDIPFTCPSLNC